MKTKILLSLVLLLFPLTSWGQSCWNSGVNFNFGTVSKSSNTDITQNFSHTCQSGSSTTYFRMCLYLGEGTASGTSGINPRKMTNYNGQTLSFNLFSDASRSPSYIIGTPPNGNGMAIYTWTAVVTGAWNQVSLNQPVYGRVPPVPNSLPAGTYQNNLPNGRLYYSYSTSGYPSSCTSQGGNNYVYSSTTATVVSGCEISINSDNDLNFGSVGGLNSPIDSTTTISLDCPMNSQWRVGLSDGANATGNQRRMKHASTNSYVNYELYRNSARTLRWGNTPNVDTVNGTGGGTGSQNITVYGRVPAQSSVPTGNYADIITVQITY